MEGASNTVTIPIWDIVGYLMVCSYFSSVGARFDYLFWGLVLMDWDKASLASP